MPSGFGALSLAAEPIAAAYGEPALAWPLRAMAISLWGQSLYTLSLNVFMALARADVSIKLEGRMIDSIGFGSMTWRASCAAS